MRFYTTLAAGVALIFLFTAFVFTDPAKESGLEKNRSTELPPPNASVGELYSMTVSTDKYRYEERRKVKIFVNITMPRDMRNVEVRYYGVKNKYGSYMLQGDDKFDLVQGTNLIETLLGLPSCSSCSGVETGPHEVNAAIYLADKQLANASTGIELVK